ncbi:MAG: hypothetical protein ABIY51_06095 [Ferruginibacter sp.]
MKKLWYLLFVLSISLNALAQEKAKDEEEKPTGFQKDKLFTGGSLNLSFGSGYTSLGLSPFFGYSLNKYLDAAVSVGYNYTSQRDLAYLGDKARQTVIGPGAFVRIYPVHFLFAHAQYEYNFIKFKYIPGNNLPNETQNFKVSSVLIGGGYTSGRKDGSMFYYLSVLWDVAKDKNSPYVDELSRTLPIFRAGIQLKLFQGKGNRD